MLMTKCKNLIRNGCRPHDPTARHSGKGKTTATVKHFSGRQGQGGGRARRIFGVVTLPSVMLQPWLHGITPLPKPAERAAPVEPGTLGDDVSV